MVHFHTIKSILNEIIEELDSNPLAYFHTIKSILNRDEKSLKPAKKS